MAITADRGGKNYVLGRGRVYFDRFPTGINVTAATQGEGRRFLGNAPEFNTAGSAENLDHFASTGGIKTKDDSVQLSLDRTGKVTCDNISRDNVAMFNLGTGDNVLQASNAAITYVRQVKQDREYQLGESAALPQGYRNVTLTSVKTGSPGFATLVPNLVANYEIDEPSGVIYIPKGSAITDDMPVQFIFSVAAATYDRVISSSSSLYGALAFISDNPKGPNRDYYYPYVKLSPDGDYNLISDDWQQMGFTFEILKKGNLEAVYITDRSVLVSP